MVRDLHTLAITPSFHIQEKCPYFSYFDCVYMSLKGNKAFRLQLVEEILACDFLYINLALALCRDFYPFFTRFGPGAFLLLPANRQDLKIWCWSHNGDITRATCEKSFHTPPAVLAIPTLRERPNVHFEKRQRGFVKRHVGAERQTSHQTLGLLLKIEFCKMI